jgi:C4-type Zn-finger protein
VPEEKFKLLVTEDDLWVTVNNTSMECPVCHANVDADSRIRHIQWHKDLARLIYVISKR